VFDVHSYCVIVAIIVKWLSKFDFLCQLRQYMYTCTRSLYSFAHCGFLKLCIIATYSGHHSELRYLSLCYIVLAIGQLFVMYFSLEVLDELYLLSLM